MYQALLFKYKYFNPYINTQILFKILNFKFPIKRFSNQSNRCYTLCHIYLLLIQIINSNVIFSLKNYEIKS